jgi:hypothetical protein
MNKPQAFFPGPQDDEVAFHERRTKRQQLRERLQAAANQKIKTKRALMSARRECTACKLAFEDASIEFADLSREFKKLK